MDQLGDAAINDGRCDLDEARLEEVLDRLDVVHRDPLDLTQLGHLVGAEPVDDPSQGGDLVAGQ